MSEEENGKKSALDQTNAAEAAMKLITITTITNIHSCRSSNSNSSSNSNKIKCNYMSPYFIFFIFLLISMMSIIMSTSMSIKTTTTTTTTTTSLIGTTGGASRDRHQQHWVGKNMTLSSPPSNSSKKKNLDQFCFQRQRHVGYEKMKLLLEKQWREGCDNITIFFAHVHHAGGTAVCTHARKFTTCNPDNNCHHPDEFNLFSPPPPTRGSKKEQLKFQKETPWRFYSVEKQMPREMILNGPFIYITILRHPYLLTISNYLRQKTLKGYKGSLEEFLTTKGYPFSLDSYHNHYHSLFEYYNIKDTYNSKQKMLLDTYKRLDKFSVILLTNDMGGSSEILQNKLNWDLEGLDIHYSANMTRAEQIHRNSQGPQDRLIQYLQHNLTEVERKLFRKTLQYDLQIFRYARCRVQWQRMSLSLPPLLDYDSKFGSLESGLAA